MRFLYKNNFNEEFCVENVVKCKKNNYEKEIAKRIYEIYIVGPVEKLDRQKLTKYGEVIDVTRKEIFGF